MPARTAVFLVLLLLMINPVWASGIAVTVTAETVVKGPVLTLGEIAQISGDDEARVIALRGVQLGAAPKPGNRLVLTRELLGGRLTAAGIDLRETFWSVPDTIVVSTQSQLVAGQKLADAAVEAIKKRINADQDKIEIELTGLASDVIAPAGDIKISAELPYGIRKGGPTLVNMLVTCDGRLHEKISLRYQVRVFADVLVAAKPIARLQVLSADNLIYQRMDTARLPSGYVTDSAKLSGLAVKRAITPGTIVTDSLVAKPVMIKRGSSVVIHARSGEIEITAAGQALQDGVEGQIIRVQNINSKRIVTAKVIDEGIVQIIAIN